MLSKNFYNFPTSVRRRASSQGADSIFGWTIFIFLLIGFTLSCWMGSFYIFGHPEKPANYRLLKRLHKLEDPQRFEITAAPRGEFLKPGQLLERFGRLTLPEREQSNEILLRNFLRNYHQTHNLVPYAVGTYRVLRVLPLTEKKFFSPGVVALLQAVEQPEILLEQVLTADQKNLPLLYQALPIGQELKLEKPLDLSAILFSERLNDGRIKFTTMPLLYGTYGAHQGTPSFSLEPPAEVNINAGLPLLSFQEVTIADEEYAASHLQRNFPKKEVKLSTATPPLHSNTPLSRINGQSNTSVTANASLTEKKEVTSPQEGLSITNTPNPPTIARALPINVPAVLPAIPINSLATTPTNQVIVDSKSTPITSPQKLPSGPSVLQPSTTTTTATTLLPTPRNGITTTNPTTALASAPLLTTPITNSPTELWPLYEPGKMPRGRLVRSSEFPTLATQGLAGERLYLQGNFSVTAAGQDRAVLRYLSSSSNGLTFSTTGKTRIIISYPPGILPPPEGTAITRNSERPFMITEIKRGTDGTINVYAQEITK